jgi:ABC-type multidrug transport system fused ATPase/permease subunit
VEKSLNDFSQASLLEHSDQHFSYGTIDQIPQNSQKFQSSSNAAVIPFTPKNAQFITIVPNRSDRFRLILELVSAFFLFLTSLIAIYSCEINEEWISTDSNGLYALTFLWSYTLALVLSRIFFMHSNISPKLGLWSNSSALYFFAWIFYLPNFRSALIHPLNNYSKWFYIAQFTTITILFLNNITSRLGDKPVLLYTSPGIQPSAEPISSLLSQATYSWIDPIIWKGYFQSLKSSDIWELRQDDHAYAVLDAYRKIKTANGIVFRMIVYFRRYLAISFAWAFLHSIIIFGPPFFMKYLLEYIEDPSKSSSNVAWLCVFGMLICGMVINIIAGQSLFIGRRICIRIRAIIIGEVYAKSLRRRASASKNTKLGQDESEKTEDTDPSQSSQGAIINLMAVDAFKISETCGYLHFFVSGLFTIFFAIVFLYKILGWSAFAGAFTMAILMPLNFKISYIFKNYQNKLMAVTDERVNKLNELLQSIRIVKFFAWESHFAKDVKEVREKELKILKKRYFMWSVSDGIWIISPMLITLISFATYTLVQGKPLTSPVAFTSLALFNLMKLPMDQLSGMLSNVLQGQVSVERIEQFLKEPETSKYNQLENTPRTADSPQIGFQKATYSWISSDANADHKNDFKLRDLDIDFKVGKLNVVVGPTGAGKSSLLLALLGEMDLISGHGFLPSARDRSDVSPDPRTGYAETSAYCAQQAWLLNDTLRNNILFGNAYDPVRYNAVIKACALSRDLEILDAGDATEIGEKGITLSGGQKQRVSLARAVYSNSKHLLLDDCLSAVDSHTALTIYENCLTGPLCFERTVILVSHNVALTISQAEFIVVMKNGRVEGQGTPIDLATRGLLGSDELVTSSAAQSTANTRVQSYADLSNAMQSQLSPSFISGDATEEDEEEQNRTKTDGKLIQEETSSEGSVKLRVYKEYIKAMGGPFFWIVLVTSFVGSQVTNVLQSYWLKIWTAQMSENPVFTIISQFAHTHISSVKTSDIAVSINDHIVFNVFNNSTAVLESGSTTQHSLYYYIAIYFYIGIFYAFLGICKSFLAYLGGLKASKVIFDQMLDSVLQAKLRFFDSTPIGRIMNRFSKDIESIDQELAPYANGTINSLLTVIAITVLISVITPSFLFASVFIAALYWAIGTFYLTSSREIKRIDSISKSPIFQHFGETLSGISTIRAYGITNRFIEQNLSKIDNNNRPFYYLWVANRWLSFRIDFAGSFVTFSAAALAMLSVGKIDSGLAGLSLSYAITFSDRVLWIVRLYAIVEMNMNSVERIQEYLDIEKEASAIIEDFRPPINWPEKGEIEVDNLSLRYAPELPLVIKNVSFKVDPFSKIGIVGRTGAGKSTIITAFFRFLEANTGSIKIDGVDISKIGLHDLRSSLAIIPQDPTLFVGTIRTNLDPFNQYSDEAIFETLKRVHLIRDSDNNDELQLHVNKNQFRDLSSPVSEGGHNLSQGQRQLICLARSLLKSPKVLLLDEATASIDYQSDALIQSTIRKEFVQTTILTIAHRLKSIVDYDKILVMDAGRVVEYDHPHVLLSNKKSLFYNMCEQSGELERLVKIAEVAYGKKFGAVAI